MNNQLFLRLAARPRLHGAVHGPLFIFRVQFNRGGIMPEKDGNAPIVQMVCCRCDKPASIKTIRKEEDGIIREMYWCGTHGSPYNPLNK